MQVRSIVRSVFSRCHSLLLYSRLSLSFSDYSSTTFCATGALSIIRSLRKTGNLSLVQGIQSRNTSFHVIRGETVYIIVY